MVFTICIFYYVHVIFWQYILNKIFVDKIEYFIHCV